MRAGIIFCLFFIFTACATITNTSCDLEKMQSVVNRNIKNSVYFKTLKEYSLNPTFYVTNLLTLETDRSINLKNKNINNSIYLFYIGDTRVSNVHFYIKKGNKIKIFESVNSPENN